MRTARVLAALITAAVLAACTSTTAPGIVHSLPVSLDTSTAKPLPVVDLAATPKGWVPLDYGNAQISVPQSWSVQYRSPDCAFGKLPGLVLVNPTATACLAPMSPQDIPKNVIELYPYSPGKLGEHPLTLNGITVRTTGGNWYDVPSLGVAMAVHGSLGVPVLNTLTRSPRAVVLGPGRPLTAPATWQRLSFGGIQVSVPRTWPVTRTNWGECGQSVFTLSGPAVTLSNDIYDLPCPTPGDRGQLVEPPTAGLRIDVGPSAVAPASVVAKCLNLHGLSFHLNL